MAYRPGSRYDDLTPREQEVLLLIREGHSDEDIAGRLGLKLGAVHYHEANIYAKLGVSTRQEAAAWEPRDEPEPPPRQSAPLPAANPSPDSDAQSVSGPPPATADQPPSTRSGILVLGAAFIVIMLIIGGGAVFGIDLGGGGDAADSDAAVAVSPSRTQRPAYSRTLGPTVTPSDGWLGYATPVPPSPYPELELAGPMDFPDGVAIIVSTGCWYCEGGPGGLVRVYLRPDGSQGEDILFDPATSGYTRRVTTNGEVSKRRAV